MHMPAFGAGTMKRIAVFYQSTVMTNTQVPAVREGTLKRGTSRPDNERRRYLAGRRIAVTLADLTTAALSFLVVARKEEHLPIIFTSVPYPFCLAAKEWCVRKY